MNSLLSMTKIISGQNVLVLDDLDQKNNFLRIGSEDLKKLTSRREYMNHFDFIFCPTLFYSLIAKNRHLFLQNIVWLLSPSSKFLFSIPNKGIFSAYKAFTIKERKDYYQVIEKTGFFKENVQYWYKDVVDDPLLVLRKWNLENPRAKWDLDNIKSKNNGNYLNFSIDMRKEL